MENIPTPVTAVTPAGAQQPHTWTYRKKKPEGIGQESSTAPSTVRSRSVSAEQRQRPESQPPVPTLEISLASIKARGQSEPCHQIESNATRSGPSADEAQQNCPVARKSGVSSGPGRFLQPSTTTYFSSSPSMTSPRASGSFVHPQVQRQRQLAIEAARMQHAGMTLYLIILLYVLCINLPFFVLSITVFDPEYVAGAILKVI